MRSLSINPIPKDIEKHIRPIYLTWQIAKVMEGLTLSRIHPVILPQLDNIQFAVKRKIHRTSHSVYRYPSSAGSR